MEFEDILACDKCDGATLKDTFTGYAGCEVNMHESNAIVAFGFIWCGELDTLDKNPTLGYGNDATVAAALNGLLGSNKLILSPLKIASYDLRPISKTKQAVGIGCARTEESTEIVGHIPLLILRGSWTAPNLANSILSLNYTTPTDLNKFYGSTTGTTQSTANQANEFLFFFAKNRWVPFFVRGCEGSYVIDIPQDYSLNFLKPRMTFRQIEIAENDDIFPGYEVELNYGYNKIVAVDKKPYCTLDPTNAADLIAEIQKVTV